MLETLSEIAVAFLSTLLSSLTGISDSIIEAFFRKKIILENEKKQQGGVFTSKQHLPYIECAIFM